MLAYVFWHWKTAHSDSSVYEDALRKFHEALAVEPPPGFLTSHTYAIADAPWAGANAYEDWYLVETSAAIDPLNEAAIAARRRGVHDAVAAMADGGTGGLYRLRLGAPGDIAPTSAQWFGKPAGMSYAEFFSLLEPIVASSDAVLWGRQMTLGPATEFCLHSTAPMELPEILSVRHLALRRL